MSYAIEVQSLHVSYDKTFVLWDVSFCLPRGVVVGVVGPNGAGKSSLLKAALGLIQPLSGTIALLGQPPLQARKKIAYVPQRDAIDWDFPISSEEVVLMGRYGTCGLFGKPKKADWEATHHALEAVGMGNHKKTQISCLSGGQQQRLFVARALVQNAELFFLDEPFAGIDQMTEKTLIHLLREETKKGKTALVIHHDLSTIEEYFDWVLFLNTRLVAYGPVAPELLRDAIPKTFGNAQVFFDEMNFSLTKNNQGWL
jgi:manganese/zinc/iron transport system ATP- binding protein